MLLIFLFLIKYLCSSMLFTLIQYQKDYMHMLNSYYDLEKPQIYTLEIVRYVLVTILFFNNTLEVVCFLFFGNF